MHISLLKNDAQTDTIIEYLYLRVVFAFLPRDAMQARPMLSCGVRPSARLSVTFVHSVKTSNRIFTMFFTVV